MAAAAGSETVPDGSGTSAMGIAHKEAVLAIENYALHFSFGQIVV